MTTEEPTPAPTAPPESQIPSDLQAQMNTVHMLGRCHELLMSAPFPRPMWEPTDQALAFLHSFRTHMLGEIQKHPEASKVLKTELRPING